MPHYKDGSLVRIGDVATGPSSEGKQVVGVVHVVTPNSSSCNMQLCHALIVADEGERRVVIPQPAHNTFYGTCSEFTKVLLALLAVTLALASPAAAVAQYRTTFGPGYQTPPASRLDRKVDGSGSQYNSGRSAEPPSSEAEKLWMFLITSDNWQNNERERQLVSWLNNDPRLVKLRTSTRFNWYAASNPHYRDRLRYKVGEALPIVCIQRPDGEALLNVTAISMPRTSGELADMADDAVNARYAPPTARSGPFSTQVVQDCPNCPDDGGSPPLDGGGQIQPIPEVIPERTSGLLWIGLGVFLIFGFGGAVFLAALFWPRGSSAQQTIF